MPEPISADQSLTEWAQLSEQRAFVYAWLSTLYATEVDERILESYLTGQAAPLFEGFSALGLGAKAQRLQAAITALHDVPYAHLELAADFAQMFLLDKKAGALPYASAYSSIQERFYGPAEERMRTFLTNASLTIQDEFKEPADHLAIYLAVMERLITEQIYTADISTAAHDQASFLDDALLCWLPEFSSRNQTVSPRFDFYPALAALLLAFVEEDARLLHEEVRLSIP